MHAPCALHAQGHEQDTARQPSQAVRLFRRRQHADLPRAWCVGGVWQDPCGGGTGVSSLGNRPPRQPCSACVTI